MKKITIILLIICFMSCSSIKFHNEKYGIIKYERFHEIKYDWYDDLYVTGSYCAYIKRTVMGISTNYIYGDFDTMTYLEYSKNK